MKAWALYVIAGVTLGIAAVLGVLAWRNSIERSQEARRLEVEAEARERAEEVAEHERRVKDAEASAKASAEALASAMKRRQEVLAHVEEVRALPENIAIGAARNIYEAALAVGLTTSRENRVMRSAFLRVWAIEYLTWHALTEYGDTTTIEKAMKDEVAHAGLLVCDRIRVTGIRVHPFFADKDLKRKSYAAEGLMQGHAVQLFVVGDTETVYANTVHRFCGAFTWMSNGVPDLIGIFDLPANTTDPKNFVSSP